MQINAPKIFRVMKPDGDKPLVENSARGLGVRVPADILLDQDDQVRPGIGGMSISPTIRLLPIHRLPARLCPTLNLRGLTGNDKDRVWRMGTGEFQDSPISDLLQLRTDRPGNGLVEPNDIMKLEEYNEALSRTQNLWKVEEQ